jgi:hypothetical protein
MKIKMLNFATQENVTEQTGLECDRCGSMNASRMNDPYLADVHGEIEEVCLCPDCFDTRAGDI